MLGFRVQGLGCDSEDLWNAGLSSILLGMINMVVKIE